MILAVAAAAAYGAHGPLAPPVPPAGGVKGLMRNPLVSTMMTYERVTAVPAASFTLRSNAHEPAI